MKASLHWLAGGLCAVALTVAGGRALASADTNAAAQVSPAMQNVTLSQSEDTYSYSSSIRNNSGQTLYVQVSARDFTSLNQTGGIAFLQNEADTNHGIASFLSVDRSTFLLQPGQLRDVTVTIHGALKLAAGGHYGALLYQLSPAQSAASSGNTVAINQTVASLLFVTTQGRGTYGIKLYRPQQSLAWWRLPQSYNLVFRNTGNVQMTPRGYINLSGPSGAQIAKGIVNADSGLILPGTNRLLAITTSPISRPLLPGYYTLRVYYRYDGGTDFSVQTTRFLFINTGFLLVAAGSIAALSIAIFVVWRLYCKPRLRQHKRHVNK